jgi:hypothetical protein
LRNINKKATVETKQNFILKELQEGRKKGLRERGLESKQDLDKERG